MIRVVLNDDSDYSFDDADDAQVVDDILFVTSWRLVPATTAFSKPKTLAMFPLESVKTVLFDEAVS